MPLTRKAQQHVSQRLPLDIANYVFDKTRHLRRQLLLAAALVFADFEGMARGNGTSVPAVLWAILAAASTVALIVFGVWWIRKHIKFVVIVAGLTFSVSAYLAYNSGDLNSLAVYSSVAGVCAAFLLIALGSKFEAQDEIDVTAQ